ncbi:hypothetical protein IFM89_009521 [Coptis chinensis]|uniref:Uncharacterized protein n=1 Tax=Coptis chinensis TaxID=261450 RepID=A0A835HRX8_9MAGN|nr:hypothetical protein IFM89_009521 [Coptis chinensis]
MREENNTAREKYITIGIGAVDPRLDLMAPNPKDVEAQTKMMELQHNISKLSERMVRDTQAREKAEKRIEDRFEQLFKLLNEGIQKGKEKQVDEVSVGESTTIVIDIDTSAMQPGHQFHLSTETQGNFLRPPKIDFP